jgi:periplasmic copper chaperone A
MTTTPLPKRSIVRMGCVCGAALAMTLLTGGVAFAHVTADPGTAIKGDRATVAFNVPTESDTAATVGFQVTLPADHPIAEVRTTPMPGWTERVKKTRVNPPIESEGERVNEVVSTITWTAQPGNRIGPGQFATFQVSMGPLPQDADQLIMPAVQIYDDGKAVSWDQPRIPGAPEPAHPAPVLTLVAASGAAATTGHNQHGSTTATPGTTETSSDNTARWLAGAGLLVGALGLMAGLRRRRPGKRRTGVDQLAPKPRQPSDKTRRHSRL